MNQGVPHSQLNSGKSTAAKLSDLNSPSKDVLMKDKGISSPKSITHGSPNIVMNVEDVGTYVDPSDFNFIQPSPVLLNQINAFSLDDVVPMVLDQPGVVYE